MQKATKQAMLSKVLALTRALYGACGYMYYFRAPRERSHDEGAQVSPCAPPFLYHSKWGDSPIHEAWVLLEKGPTLLNNS